MNLVAKVKSIPGQFIAQCFKTQKIRMLHRWGYANSELPPNDWHKDYKIAAGKNQSPIDLKSCSTEAKVFSPFQIDYNALDVKSLSNNGHSVTFSCSGGKSSLRGGPLSDKYTLEQFHFHWGSNSSIGSEHLLDGKSFAAELHLVHWNSDKYSSFIDSIAHPDGLCVLGVFLQAGDKENVSYTKVMDEVAKVPLKDDAHNLPKGVDPQILLPNDITSYFHYAGSLTTPPLNECVQWVVFKDPVSVSEAQLATFRALHTGKDKSSACLCDNNRPVQEIKSRVLYST